MRVPKLVENFKEIEIKKPNIKIPSFYNIDTIDTKPKIELVNVEEPNYYKNIIIIIFILFIIITSYNLYNKYYEKNNKKEYNDKIYNLYNKVNNYKKNIN